MANGGLGKLRLELEIAGDKVVVTGLTNVDAAVDRTARSTKSATDRMAADMDNSTAATGRMAAGIGGVSTATAKMAADMHGHTQKAYMGMSELEMGIMSVTMRIMNLTMAAGLIAAPFLAAGAVIFKGLNILDDFQQATTTIAAQLTQMQGPKDIAQHYKESVVYAGALAVKMEEVDANSRANSQGLTAMLQTMTQQGVVLDINNKKQVDSFTALSNAIAMNTQGQDQQIQMFQETRSLMSGVVDMHSQVSRSIDQAIKQEGIYKGGLKEVVELGKQHGDTLERLTPYLSGVLAATEDISHSWSAAKSSTETTVNALIRSGWKETIVDVTGWLQTANVYLKEHSTEIGGRIREGWQLTKGFIEGSFIALKAGGVVLQTTIIPLFTDTWYLIKGTAETLQTVAYILQSAPGLLVPLGVAAYYAVGGIAAMTVAYTALTTTITASMASNPIGWVALGIAAVTMAAKPAVQYLDELLYKYTGLNLTGEAYYNAELKRAADADKAWEDQKKKALWMNKEGGIPLSPGMQSALGPQAPKIQPPPVVPPEFAEDKYIKDAERVRESYLQYSNAFDARQLAAIKNSTDLQLAELKNRHDQGLVGEQQYLDAKYALDKAAIAKDESILLDAAMKAQRAADAAETTMNKTRQGDAYDADAINRRNKALSESEVAWKAVEAAENKALLTDVAYAGATELSAKKQLSYHAELEENMNGLWKKQVEATASLSRLSIENKLAEINTQEKFYQLTAGDAAVRRINLLEQALDLETAAFKVAEGDKLLQEQFYTKIQSTNAALLEQKKILADSTAMGGATSALAEYARAAADIGAQTKGLVTDMLQGMEDALVSFVQTGKLSFRSLADSIIADISRIMVKMSIAGLVSKGSNIYNSWTTDSTDKSYGVMADNANSGFGGGEWFSAAGTAGTTAYSAYTPAAAGAGVAAPAAGASGVSSMGYTGWGAVIAGIIMQGMGYAKEFGKGGEWRNRGGDQQRQMQGGQFLSGGSGIADVLNIIDYYTGGKAWGTGWHGKASGLSLGVEGGDLEAQSYLYSEKKKSFFRGTSRKTEYGEIDSQLQEYLSGQYSAIVKGVTSGSRILGNDAAGLGSFTSAAKTVSLSGLDAEGQQKAVAAYFRGISVEAIDTLYPEIKAFSKMGEDSADTFQRLTSSLQIVNANFTLLGVPLIQLGLDGAAVADTLVQALGGLDSAVSAFNSYYSSGLFTDAEQKSLQVQAAQSAVNDTFARLGLTLPQTNEEFKALVNSQLALGESGAEAAAELLRVAPAFATVTDSVQQLVTDLEAANSRIIAAAAQTLTASISVAGNLLGALKTILTGPLANLSPGDAYSQAKTQFATADASNAGERGQLLLEASRNYNASGSAYQADLAAVKTRLGQLAQVAPTLSFVEQQIKLLGEIKTAVETGDAAQAAALEITFNAAQIDMGLAGNSLSKALAGIQGVLNTPITTGTAQALVQAQLTQFQSAINSTLTAGTARTAILAQVATLQTAINTPLLDGTAKAAAIAQIAALQAAVNTAVTAGTAKTALTAQISLMQAALNTAITPATADDAITAQIAALQASLNTGVTGTARDAINNSISLLQLALNGTVTAATATTGINLAYTTVQGALNGSINGTTAATAIALQAATAQAALNKSITGSTAATAIALQAATVQAALDKSITGATAKTAIDAQYAIIQGAANGTITAAAAKLKLETQYAIIQQAANGAISSATAAATIQAQYDAVTASLGTGVSGALTTVSDALTLFNKAIASSAADTAKGLANFVTAMEIMQTYSATKTSYDTGMATRKAQFLSSGISIEDYTNQSAAAYAPLKATYDKGVAAGLTTLSAPTAPDSAASLTDARMRNLASSAGFIDKIGQMSLHILPADLKYDIGPVINGRGSVPDGKVDIGDVSVWQYIANGLIPWSMTGLPAFATGSAGIPYDMTANIHQGEKIIDARSSDILSRYGIKVQATGSADNKETVAELKEQNRLLRELLTQGQAKLKISQAGFSALVDGQQKGNKSLKTVEGGTTLQKRAVNQ